MDDRMKILRGYVVTTNNQESTLLVRGAIDWLNGETVQEWPVTTPMPSLATIVARAFSDHLEREGRCPDCNDRGVIEDPRYDTRLDDGPTVVCPTCEGES